MADRSTTTWSGGTEHWTRRRVSPRESGSSAEVKLFLWNKKPPASAAPRGD